MRLYSYIIRIQFMDSKEINIPSTIQDVNYRYRMPKMIIKSESRGNGVKTNITNLVDVAKALDVPVDCTPTHNLRHTQVFQPREGHPTARQNQ